VFGHRIDADAHVVASQHVKTDLASPTWHETWRFILDVQPPGGAPYRATLEQRLACPHYRPPSAGESVHVRYDEKYPDQLELNLKHDERYDTYYTPKHTAADAARQEAQDAAWDAAAQAPPGTPVDPPPAA
jgi:hypothetical protein